MTEKINRNDPCSCGSGKKYKKCCGVQKKLSQRNATVISSSSANSLLSRITAGGKVSGLALGEANPLKDRTSKQDLGQE